MLDRGPTREPASATTRKKSREEKEKNEVECTRKVELVKIEFLVAGEACTAKF